MTDIPVEVSETSEPVEEVVTAVVEATTEKTTAVEAVAEVAPVENVKIEEAVEPVKNDDGQKVISGPKKTKAPRKSNSFVTETGAVGSRAADAALKNKKSAAPSKSKETDQVGIWSDKNIRWSGVGELSKGYNIVKKEAAEKWLTKTGIREATPEEIAAYYGK